MTSTAKQQFLKAFEQATELERGGVFRVRGGVKFEVLAEVGTGFKIGENEVYLNSLRALEQRKGMGREAMGFLTSLADRFNVDIVLHACGLDDDSPSDYALRQFYRQFGFVKCGSNNAMVRMAASQNGAALQPQGPA